MSKGTFDFKKISSIEELYNDARFLKEMINNTEIIIGSNILKYDNLKLNDDLKKDLDFIIDFYDICKIGNMQIVVPLSEFEEIDIQNAIRVVEIFRGKIEIKNDYIYTYNLKIAERIYPFIVYRDEHDKVQFVNRIYESKYQGYITTNDNHYKVPMFCDMKRDVLGHLYRYDYADLLYRKRSIVSILTKKYLIASRQVLVCDNDLAVFLTKAIDLPENSDPCHPYDLGFLTANIQNNRMV